MKRLLSLLTFVVLGLAGPVRAATIAVPPVFSVDAPVEQTLLAYPLGVVSQQAAFSHHGGPHGKVRLANGLEGWVYDVGGVRRGETYVTPGGGRQSVRETEAVHAPRRYTLVFDSRGAVVDVLYNERGRHDGLSALALQNRRGTSAAPAQHVDPGPRR